MNNNKNNIRKMKWVFILALTFLPRLIWAQEEKPAEQYLSEYLILAAENNPNLKGLYHTYLAALEQVKQEGVLPDPQVSFGYYIQPFETRVGAQRATASLSQMFPWFGTLDAKEQVAAEKARLKLHMFHIAKKELYRDIEITYNKLYYLDKATQITEENLKLLESLNSLSQVHFESGKSGFTSVLQVEMEQEELQSQLEYLQDSRLPLVSEFEQLLNTELQAPIEFPEALWKERLLLDKSAILDSIRAKSPHLVHYEHEEKIHEYEIDVAKKEGLPSISIGMSYTSIAPRTDFAPGTNLADNGKDAFLFPQVGIRIPLYRKRYKAMKQEAILKQKAVQFSKHNLENELFTEFERQYRDYLDAQRKIKLYRNLSKIANQSLSLLQTQLSTDENKNNFFEIVRMERQLLDYNLKLEKAKANQNNAVYNINYLMGK